MTTLPDSNFAALIPIGGEQELKDAIVKIREMGGHAILYIQYRLMDVYSHYYAEGGRDWAMKSPAAGHRAGRSVDIGERERIEEYRSPEEKGGAILLTARFWLAPMQFEGFLSHDAYSPPLGVRVLT